MLVRLARTGLVLLILAMLPAVAGAISVSIATPKPGATIPYRSVVSGTVSGVKATVWVLVHQPGHSTYWIQPRVKQKPGQWTGVAYVGTTKQDAGKDFEIIAVVNPRAKMEEGDVLLRMPDCDATHTVRVKRR